MDFKQPSKSAAKNSGVSSTEPRDPRLYSDLKSLVSLKSAATKLSFQKGHFRTSNQAGRHNSAIRGRGLNFEELRHYQDGDDVKNMDWRTTLRTGKPHVRAYSEEKERQSLLVVDQRSGMFFGSQHAMKSVVAAQLSALSIWNILQSGDRIGGIVFNDNHWQHIKPKRSSANALVLCQAIVEFNQQLSADTIASDPATSLNNTLLRLNKMVASDSSIIIVSDWQGFNADSLTLLKQLQRSNDVVLVYVHDKLERELHNIKNLVASDGLSQMAMDYQQITERVPEFFVDYESEFKQKLAELNQASRSQILPVIDIDTNGDELSQFFAALYCGRR
ncbi:DUF58 domain-containing protein [Shewanella youngdeokensis]|uniref:DUF58 domain-containing protein n=1 Tax=Shewanella youngdeokensis TaxID=2999068 RepID=A0ABZ0K478_9GAMM|nr:DUF58 domain-containing protein [Shewanella sp. DAU334]